MPMSHSAAYMIVLFALFDGSCWNFRSKHCSISCGRITKWMIQYFVLLYCLITHTIIHIHGHMHVNWVVFYYAHLIEHVHVQLHHLSTVLTIHTPPHQRIISLKKDLALPTCDMSTWLPAHGCYTTYLQITVILLCLLGKLLTWHHNLQLMMMSLPTVVKPHTLNTSIFLSIMSMQRSCSLSVLFPPSHDKQICGIIISQDFLL